MYPHVNFDFYVSSNENPVEIVENDVLLIHNRRRNISTGFWGVVGTVLNFAKNGSGSHDFFIIVLTVIRIGQILFLSGHQGAYVGTKKV